MTKEELRDELMGMEVSQLCDIICEFFNAETNVWFSLFSAVSEQQRKMIMANCISNNVKASELEEACWIERED